MTLDEAVNQSLEQIAGLCNAMQVAGRNGGKPIFDPKTGRPVNLQGPPLANVLLVLLNSQSIMLQVLRTIAASLQGGFALSDPEAQRIADFLLARIRALDSAPPEGVHLDHEVTGPDMPPQRQGDQSPP